MAIDARGGRRIEPQYSCLREPYASVCCCVAGRDASSPLLLMPVLPRAMRGFFSQGRQRAASQKKSPSHCRFGGGLKSYMKRPLGHRYSGRAISGRQSARR